ncbi:MAG: glycosyltransferase family 4 protein [Syntrophobacterales bacterium]|nr:glycosyltransferase family 4 protein [Syntrophobacterales bacterium]
MNNKSAPKRVAVVIPKYGLTGGAEDFCARLSEHIAQNEDYEIHVLANRWQSTSPNVSFHGIPIVRFPRYLITTSFAFFTRRLLKKMPYDLIHTHDRIFEADIYTMHGIPHRRWVKEVRKKRHMSLFDLGTQWVEKKLVTGDCCRFFHAVSNLTKEKFLQEYPTVDPNRVRVIHPGIDAHRFSGLDRIACRREIRERFGMGPRDRVVLFASMNVDIRGLDRLVEGLARVRPAGQNDFPVKLLVAGKGNVKRYRSLARKLGIEENVVFAGVADRETLDKMYLAADMFSILSQFDTFSMTTLEAMAASLPVIISGNVGAKDLVKEGVNGFIVEDVDDAEEIADRIEKMSDDSVRVRMAGEAFKTARAHTWEDTAGKIEEMYEEILRDKRRF